MDLYVMIVWSYFVLLNKCVEYVDQPLNSMSIS